MTEHFEQLQIPAPQYEKWYEEEELKEESQEDDDNPRVIIIDL